MVGAAGSEPATQLVRGATTSPPACPDARQCRPAASGPSTAERSEATTTSTGPHPRFQPVITAGNTSQRPPGDAGDPHVAEKRIVRPAVAIRRPVLPR